MTRLGISLASYLPWSAWFPEWAARQAREAGYEFLQVLPFRGVKENTKLPLPISYIEEAWNPGSLVEVISGKIKKMSRPPKLEDWLFFPERIKSTEIFLSWLIFREEWAILHKLFLRRHFKRALLEVSPGIWLNLKEIKKFARGKRKILCLDLWHLRRDSREDELLSKPAHLPPVSPLGPWQESLKELLPYTFVIHISPQRDFDELSACLAGKPTELEKMLKVIKDFGFEGDYIVEATLGLGGFNFRKLKKVMKEFHDWVRRLIEN